ncbi:hypothetical protein D3C85_1246210 [compost metagenome]
MKKGAPTAAVNTPTGTSSGRKNVLPARSANITIAPPSRAETGKRLSKLEPTHLRAICGAIKPMKPIAPATETADPANPTLMSSRSKRLTSTALPALAATSSPSCPIFTWRASRKASGIKITVHGNTVMTFSQFAA